MFRLDDYWVWDSWIVRDGDTFHLFHLKAPRALGDPRLRHERAVIGHASSTDLRSWVEHPDALHPSESGWDDLALWTGSVVQDDDGRWRMFYTAIGTGGYGILDQRIGVAESSDLETWTRARDRPVVEPDARWYQTLDGDDSASETWRDPFVFRDEGGDGWHMLFTARLRGAPRNDNGVIGHAWSADLETWEVGPPLSEPAGFGQIEVIQVRVIDGRHVLAFTCHPDEQSDARRSEFPACSTWSLVGESALGPWDFTRARPFIADPDLFAAPLVQQPDGVWAFVGFRNLESQGRESFELTDPIPVRLENGALRG